MAWKKPDPAFSSRVSEVLLSFPEVFPRKMFGMPCHFIQGNMWSGPFEDRIFVRFSAPDRQALLKDFPGISEFEPTPGRKMKEYLSMSEEIFTSPAFREFWLPRSYAFVKNLPPKPEK